MTAFALKVCPINVNPVTLSDLPEQPIFIAAELLLLIAILVDPAPAPSKVIEWHGTITAAVQVHAPAGIFTVSPSAAELIAVWTSVEEQEAALTVAA